MFVNVWIAVFLLFLSGCINAETVNVLDYGAIPNDGIDDREEIQAAIDAASGGGRVIIPAGVYHLSKTPGKYYSLTLDGVHGITIEGEPGSVLVQEAGIGVSVRMIAAYEADSSEITIKNLTLDGNKENQTENDHRHGLFFGNIVGLTVQNLEARNFTGDGIYIYVAVQDVAIDNVHLHDNGRNGLTIGGYVTGLTLTNSRLVNNAAQQFDSEGYKGQRIDDVSIIGNTLISPRDYAVAAGGTGTTTLGTGWRIIGNRIESGGKGVRLIWLDGAVFSGNAVNSGVGNFPGVEVYHRNKGIVITDNTITSPNYGNTGGVAVIGTGGGVTDFVTISGNQIDTKGGDMQTGIRVQGARNALIIGNQVVSDYVGALTPAAIFVRATRPIDSVLVAHNIIIGPTYYGIRITEGPETLGIAAASMNIIMNAAVDIQCLVCE